MLCYFAPKLIFYFPIWDDIKSRSKARRAHCALCVICVFCVPLLQRPDSTSHNTILNPLYLGVLVNICTKFGV